MTKGTGTPRAKRFHPCSRTQTVRGDRRATGERFLRVKVGAARVKYIVSSGSFVENCPVMTLRSSPNSKILSSATR